MTLIVNLYGGPGTGKSTTAAATFAELKFQGVNCELVTEYAKDLVWGRTTVTLDNQLYLLGKQYHRLWRMLDQVDVVVTDSPLLLFTYYGRKQSETFRQLVLETYQSMDNYNIFLKRVKEYNPAGRVQTEDEAREIDFVLADMLSQLDPGFDVVSANMSAAGIIAGRVISRLG